MIRILPTADRPLIWRLILAAAIAAAVIQFAPFPTSGAALTGSIGDKVSPVRFSGRPALTDALVPQTDEASASDADDSRQSNALMPIADGPPTPAAPFYFFGDRENRDRGRDCLALAAWYEAGDDPSGERAVIQVILNRVRHPNFPNSICAVVFQGSERQTGCQFTFTCDGSLTRKPSAGVFARARAIAASALSGAVDPRVGLATQYHADYVVPYWRDEFIKIARDGAHLFYRWPGYWGSSAVMVNTSRSVPEPVIPTLGSLSYAHNSTTAPNLATQDETLAIALVAPPSADDPNMQPPLPANVIDMPLDPTAPSGHYALQALVLCQDVKDCRVAGRVEHEIAFIYIRKGSNHREGLYWDCTRFKRTDPAQCLSGMLSRHRLLANS